MIAGGPAEANPRCPTLLYRQMERVESVAMGCLTWGSPEVAQQILENKKFSFEFPRDIQTMSAAVRVCRDGGAPPHVPIEG